jgi:uncharacterized short protein YbdD (DUF466 family)
MRDRRNVGNVGNVGNARKVGSLRSVGFDRYLRRASQGMFLAFHSFPTFLTFLRRIAGMPDYELHLEHLRRCHPEQRIPTEREYFEEYLRTRYNPERSRCC